MQWRGERVSLDRILRRQAAAVWSHGHALQPRVERRAAVNNVEAGLSRMHNDGKVFALARTTARSETPPSSFIYNLLQ
jgi:hypothetical protein